MERISIDITKTNSYQANNTVFVIGRFQALHVGHQHLLKEAKRLFPNRQLGVITFSPDPRDYFSQTKQSKILTYQERLDKLEGLAVDVFVEFVFNEAFAKMTKSEFLALMEKMNIDAIIHGEDFQFGSQEMRSEKVTSKILYPVSDLIINQQKVSSSVIVDYLQTGEMETLNAYLNYPYSITGVVVHGEKRASELGFPTANQAVAVEKSLPENGVYATRTEVDGVLYDSVTHIGPSPTFERSKRIIETHILNYRGNLYGKVIKVFFYAKIRAVKRFSEKEAIKAQINDDIMQVEQFFNH